MDELTDLIAFIRACLAWDEQLVIATIPPGWARSWRRQQDGQARIAEHGYALTRTGKDELVAESLTAWDADLIAARDPAWALPDIAAKRLLLDKLETWLDDPVTDIVLRVGPGFIRALLVRLAASYPDRPGFRPEWAAAAGLRA